MSSNPSVIFLRKCHLPCSQRRLFVSPIITQIGRENKSSADIYMCIRRGDLRSPAGEHSSPLPCFENILMRTSLMRVNFFCFYFIYMCIRRGDLRSPADEHSSPLPCSENILMRTSLMRVDFYYAVYKKRGKAVICRMLLCSYARKSR